MLAICRDIWERNYAHLAPHKNVKKRDAFEKWLYRRKGEDTVTDEFRWYFTACSAIPATEKFDPIAWRSARYRRSLPYPPALGLRCIRLSNNMLRMRASL